MNPDYVDTAPATMSPEEIKRATEAMERFREHEAMAKSAYRLFLALLAVYVLGVALGQL